MISLSGFFHFALLTQCLRNNWVSRKEGREGLKREINEGGKKGCVPKILFEGHLQTISWWLLNTHTLNIFEYIGHFNASNMDTIR